MVLDIRNFDEQRALIACVGARVEAALRMGSLSWWCTGKIDFMFFVEILVIMSIANIKIGETERESQREREREDRAFTWMKSNYEFERAKLIFDESCLVDDR